MNFTGIPGKELPQEHPPISIMTTRHCFLLPVFLLLCSRAQAQLNWLKTENDSAYVNDHSNDLTVRLYGSNKFTNYRIIDRDDDTRQEYKPNDRFNIGIGANYKFIGLNIGFSFPFINNDNNKFGKTRYLDLQSHLYFRKLAIDFIGQFYKGYYISSPDLPPNFSGIRYPYRPDLVTNNIGINTQYIFNDRRFSYRATFLQNEYQKKSAGSALIGGNINFIRIKGDSTLVRQELWNNFDYSRSNIFNLGVNGGYAYTFVIRRHFFITASLVGGLGVNITRLQDADGGNTRQQAGVHYGYTVRTGAGYNSERYYAGLQYVLLTSQDDTPIEGISQSFSTGNFRINFARRFKITRTKLGRTLEKATP